MFGVWWEGERGFIQPAEFLLGRGGVVLGSMYASGPVGRMGADEAVRLITTREAPAPRTRGRRAFEARQPCLRGHTRSGSLYECIMLPAARGRYVTMICSSSSTPPAETHRERVCCRAASMACTGTTWERRAARSCARHAGC